MFYSPLVWALFSLTLMIAIPGALASPSPKRLTRKTTTTRHTIETYPALEDEEINLPRPRTVERVREIPPSRPILVGNYEVVPEEKRNQILKRMALCEVILKEFGRAYDYRNMTTPDLEREFNSLRGTASPQASASTTAMEP